MLTVLPSDTLDFARRMFEAARNGDTSLILSAVDAGLPVNLTNDKGQAQIPFPRYGMTYMSMHAGNTLLMLAAYAGHTELTKGLLERGADPNRSTTLDNRLWPAQSSRHTTKLSTR